MLFSILVISFLAFNWKEQFCPSIFRIIIENGNKEKMSNVKNCESSRNSTITSEGQWLCQIFTRENFRCSANSRETDRIATSYALRYSIQIDLFFFYHGNGKPNIRRGIHWHCTGQFKCSKNSIYICMLKYYKINALYVINTQYLLTI